MSLILLGLASCQEANVSAPVVRALLAAGHEVRIAWFGSTTEFEQAAALGLPDTDTVIAGDFDDDSHLLQACEFLNDEWLQCPIVLSNGHDSFAVALAETAHERGAKVIRLGAGERVGDVRDAKRRRADHAADAFCVSTDAQRQQLLNEGFAEERIAVVGSLQAQVLAELPEAPTPESPFVWFALEHGQTSEFHGEELLVHCEEAASNSGLALQQASAAIPAAEQLALARSASVIVTDSVGYQELASASGIPCIVLAPAGARWDLLVSGSVQVVDRAIELRQAIPQAFERRAAAVASEGTIDAAGNVVQAIDGWIADPDAPVETSTGTLPTEANATGRTFDESELRLLNAALRSGTLNSTRGTFVSRFESEFAEWIGSKHAIACASGSAAVHCAIAAIRLAAGDEVITTSITDMGALTPIFYEGAVPVFADVDPVTLNVTAATIEAQLTDRTKAIIVTHLFGRPCDLQPIMALAAKHGIPVIEDAAQAFGATQASGDAPEAAIGTIGKIGCFSLQQGKHITTGEGGIVCTDDDDAARRMFLFVNKAWGYGDKNPDHYFPALNYRLTELQGAVACAQLPKLDEVVAHRRMIAADLHSRLSHLTGIACPEDPSDGTHSYWKFAFRVDAKIIEGGAVELGSRMRAQGIACAPRYVVKPAFECQLFRDWRNSPVTSMPLQNNPRGQQEGALFDRVDYPGSVQGLEQVVVLPINERYRPHHVETVANAIVKAHGELSGGRKNG
ncbi:MAG: perosamine synthetase [Planctomycetota bacterium]